MRFTYGFSVRNCFAMGKMDFIALPQLRKFAVFLIAEYS